MKMDRHANETDLKKAMVKRALGFYSTDTVEEYENGEEGEKLVKRKVSRKFNPPDLNALRELLGRESAAAADMSDEELSAEREELLARLREEIKGE